MNPNIDLSVWQMTLMAVVPVATLAFWLIAIYVVAREPRRPDLAAAGSPAESAAAGTGSPLPAKPGEPKPERLPTDRRAA
jgi:hypothetical protein